MGRSDKTTGKVNKLFATKKSITNNLNIKTWNQRTGQMIGFEESKKSRNIRDIDGGVMAV